MINITVDDRQLRKNMRNLAEREVRWAAKFALDNTAADVLAHVQARMDQVFDRPTRFTKNAFMVKKAHTRTLEAQVTERPSVGRRHYLKVQEFGGRRNQTGLEGLLNARIAPDGGMSAATPASAARLNAHGNWMTGERNQALAAVQAQRDASPVNARGGRRKSRKRAGFFVPRAGSKLSPGIWKRNADGSIQKVLHFTRAMPVYDERLGFFDGAEQVWGDRLPEHLRRTIARAVDRAASRG